MAGVLILAAGVPRAFEDRDFAVASLGYVVMRIGAGRPVAAGRRAPIPRAGRAACATRPASRPASSAGWRAWLLPDGVAVPSLPRAGGGRAARCRLWAERAGAHAVAPAAHRRALRPVHDHRARRVGARGDHRRAGRRSTPTARFGDAGHGRRRRAADRVLDVVDLLRHAGRATCVERARARRSPNDSAAPFAVGLRPLRRLRRARPRPAPASRWRSTRRPTTRSSPTSRPGFAVTVPVAVYLVAVWALHLQRQAARARCAPSPSPSPPRSSWLPAPRPSRCSSPACS